MDILNDETADCAARVSTIRVETCFYAGWVGFIIGRDRPKCEKCAIGWDTGYETRPLRMAHSVFLAEERLPSKGHQQHVFVLPSLSRSQGEHP